MAAQSFLAGGNRLVRRPPVRRNGLVQLGWAHFWLFAGILGGLLFLAVPVIFLYLMRE